VAVDDPDQDPMTVTWTITRGTLTAQNAAKTLMEWVAPSSVGVDTVTVRVTDGSVTRSVSAAIKVGYPASVAPAVFLKSRSPYIVAVDPSNPTLPIDAGQISTIEPGTELLLDTPGMVIDVSGTLIANGTAGEHVVIRPNVRGLQCGDERGWWEGIRGYSFAPDDGDIQLNHTEVWYAESGVRLINNASASLHDCLVRCSGDAGIQHDGAGRLDVFDTQVTDGEGTGIAIGNNVSTSLPDTVRIDGCDLRFNGTNGLHVNINDVLAEAQILVTYNVIESNIVHGVALSRSSFPQMHYNTFRANGVGGGISNIFLSSGFPGSADVDTLNATCNFWGSVIPNQTIIDQTIRDSQDAPGTIGTRVWTNPWLNEDPRVTPPSCTP
jgi:hypothetical protein